jgi:hypothetical protein
LLWIVFLALAPLAQGQENKIAGCEDRKRDVKTNYPVLSTDHFDVVYIDGCLLVPIWNDHGTGKDQSISFWRPDYTTLSTAGYGDYLYPGAYFTTALDLEGDRTKYATFIFKPKAGKADVVKPHTGYTEVWNDSGSDAHNDASFWELDCPSGYISLGLHVVDNHSKPTSSRIACVRWDLTYPLEINKPGIDHGSFWTSDATDADRIGIYGVKRTKTNTQKNKVVLPPPTFWAKKDSYDPPSLDKFRGLLLPITPVPLHPSPSARRPVLTKPDVEGFEDSPDAETEKGYSISALLVNDPLYSSDLERLLASPEYYVHRTTTWKPVDGGQACPWDSPDNCTYHYTVTRGESETTTWNNTIGLTLSQSLETDASFAPLGVGLTGKLSLGIEESYSHEFGGDSGTSTEEGTEKEFPLRPGMFGVGFESESTVRLYRHNDKDMKAQNLVREYTADTGGSRTDVSTFPLPKENVVAGCADPKNRDLVQCGLPAYEIHHLPQNQRILSQSGKHYLILTKYGTLEVRNADVGRYQHTHVWSVDQKHSLGTHKNPIADVRFEHGVLCATSSTPDASKADKWCNIDEDEKIENTYLEIDEEGNLRVVDADGEVIWNSKYDEEEES